MTGGAFIKGGVNIPYQLPHHWVQRTQAHIVVSINYRVGIMGFPNARGLNSQNLGILDQRMAHEWVRDNIEAFGGDPSKITLWGQSAGAESADFHGFAYYNDSIATGVVMQSGTAFLPQKSYDFQNSNFTFVASHLGCGRMNATAELDCMRQKPVESIVNFVGRRTDNATEPALSFMPIPDNNIVFSNYTDRYAKGLVARAPAVVGTTSNEASAIVGTNLTAPTQELVEQMTLGSFVCPAHTTAELRDEKGLLTYRYQYAGNFSNLSPLPWLGAYHDADAPLFFGTFDDFSEGSELEARTSEVMQDLLLEFMKDPYNGPEQMGWPESGTGRMLRLGVSEHAVLDIPTQEVDAACDGQGEYASSL
ncbi:Alpha/Beta hydrolase protein [Aspergillus ambiguus]|uniref:Alpha/Beta hydrolase protein n=1 Tax=Aspergillus ambiguus TaxID=176160 RepID=UPI003CCD54BC